jgi:hypothetical protein
MRSSCYSERLARSTREEMVASLRCKIDACIAAHMRRSSLASARSTRTRDGKHSAVMLSALASLLEAARENAARMTCTWLAWHRTDLSIDHILALVVEAGIEADSAALMRPRMEHVRLHGPDALCPDPTRQTQPPAEVAGQPA